MPKDRVTQMHQGYGFVEFMGEEDADYSIKIMNMIKLYGKPIRVNKVCMYVCMYVCMCACTEQIGSSSNASDLYLIGSWLTG
jgi:hypothetical protein